MKVVKSHLSEKNPDRVDAFEKGAQTFAKKIVGSFKDFEFVRLMSMPVCDYPLTLFMCSTPASR